MQTINQTTNQQSNQISEDASQKASEFGREWDELEASIIAYCQGMQSRILIRKIEAFLTPESQVVQ